MADLATQAAVAGNVAVISLPTAGLNSRELHKQKLYKFGIVEVLLGCLAFAVSLVAIVLNTTPLDCNPFCYGPPPSHLTDGSAGLWCGVFLFISGGLGICARKSPGACMYNANMAMSVISAAMMGVLGIMSTIAAGTMVYFSNEIMAAHIAQVLIAVTAMAFSIAHSVFCCVGTCYQKSAMFDRVAYVATSPQFDQAMAAQGQPMPVQSYPTISLASAVPSAPVEVELPRGVRMPVTLVPSQPGIPQEGTAQELGIFPRQEMLPPNPPSYLQSLKA